MSLTFNINPVEATFNLKGVLYYRDIKDITLVLSQGTFDLGDTYRVSFKEHNNLQGDLLMAVEFTGDGTYSYTTQLNTNVDEIQTLLGEDYSTELDVDIRNESSNQILGFGTISVYQPVNQEDEIPPATLPDPGAYEEDSLFVRGATEWEVKTKDQYFGDRLVSLLSGGSTGYIPVIAADGTFDYQDVTTVTYTDSDAVSAIKSDADWNAADWDTAYGWGDHNTAGYLTDLSTLDTDNLTEGSTNLYFTDARAISAIQSDASWNAADWDTAYGWGDHSTAGYLTDLSTLDTDNLDEGSTNLYFTDARAISAIQSDASWNASDWDTAYGWGDHSTAGYEETTNKGQPEGYCPLNSLGYVSSDYFTPEIMTWEGTWNASTNSPTLVDGTGDTGQVYQVTTGGTRDLGSGDITFRTGDLVVYSGLIWLRVISSDRFDEINGYTSGTVTLDTDDIDEGSTNLYYTSARFSSDFATKDTDDLAEGSTNLYFTDARAISAITDTSLDVTNITTDVVTLTADDSLTASHSTVLLDGSSNTVTLSLLASPTEGQIWNIVCVDATNTVTVDTNTAAVNGSTSDITLSTWESITIQGTGSGEYTIL